MKISVVIATRNRKDDLKICLEGFLIQTYKDFDIIVIDNQSTDGTKEMMSNEFKNIKYLWLPDNIDILAQNLGRELTDGEIIWRTDSDAHPESEDMFQKVVSIFQKHSDIDIISTIEVQVNNNYNIVENQPGKIDYENPPEKGYKANNFMGAGAAIRRRVFDKVGGFWQFGMEEIDFSTRAILAGCNIRYFPNLRTLHYASQHDRNKSERWLSIYKQMLRYIWKYYPLGKAFFASLSTVISSYIDAVGQKIKLGVVIQSFFTFHHIMLNTIRNERMKVNKEEYEAITLGVPIHKRQIKYLRNRIKSKFSKK